MIVQHEPQRDFRSVFAPQQAHLDKAPAGGEAAQIAGEIVTADEVDDHIHTPPLRGVARALLEILRPIVEHRLCAEARDIRAALRIGGGEDAGTKGVGDLHSGGADAAGGGKPTGIYLLRALPQPSAKVKAFTKVLRSAIGHPPICDPGCAS